MHTLYIDTILYILYMYIYIYNTHNKRAEIAVCMTETPIHSPKLQKNQSR